MADIHDARSFSNRMRARRFVRFELLASRLARPLRIIDIGGTNGFWEQRGWAGCDDVQITLVNIEPQPRRHENIEPCVGSAIDLSEFGDRSFDIAFSNSVIEHLFSFENQAAMARELRRVAPAYWVQTPNFWFPIEPHFLVPGWHWLPGGVRVALIRRRRFGWRGPCRDRAEARRLIQEVRLLTRRELRQLFPDARVLPERFAGMVKSWVVYGGFPP